MSFHLQVGQKKILFFLAFFSCFSFKNLSLGEDSGFFQERQKVLVVDQRYLQIQADIFYLKSEMAYYEGETVQAIDYLKEAILHSPDSLHLRFRLAQIFQEEKLFAEATQQYQFLLEQDPENKTFRHKLTEIYSFRGLNQEALKEYKNYQKTKDFSINFRQALLFADEQAWQSSLNFLNQAWKQAGTELEKGEVLLSKAYIYGQTQQPSKQEKVFKQILDLQLLDENFLLKTTEFYRASKKLKEAKAMLLQYQQKDASSIPVTQALFNLYLDLDQPQKAYEQLAELQKLAHLENRHYFFLISFLSSKKQYAEMVPFIKDLVQKDPLNDYYRYLLGATYEQDKQWEKSIEEYKKIQKMSPYYITAQIQMGQIWKDQGQTRKALNLLEKVSFSPQNLREAKPLLLYASYLWEEGQKKRAIYSLTKGLNIFPKNTDVLFLRGFYLGKLDQTDKALKDMEKVLSLNSHHGEALNFIAYTYAEQKQSLNRAEALAYKALSLSPASSYFLDTLGWVFFQKGDYKKALNYLSKAFSYNKKDGLIVEHLGETYYQLKNFEKCEYFFRQALELERNEKKRSQIKKRLATLQTKL